MQVVFEREKSHYEAAAHDAIRSGLVVSSSYPWQHLKGFYEWCGKFVQFFEQSGQQFGAIPDELRIAPEIARRL